MASNRRRRLEDVPLETIKDNGKRNGLNRTLIWLSVIISSAIVGGYVFDSIRSIVIKDMKLEQHTDAISQLGKQLEMVEKEINEIKADNARFGVEVLKTTEDMSKALETVQQTVSKLDKNMRIIDSIDVNLKKLTEEN